MTLIATSDEVAAFCHSVADADFITVDTEFLRDRTYWPILCVMQIGGPGEAAAIDTLAEGIDLAPVLKLITDHKVLKVFHAARQDVEIFYHLSKKIPAPIFDTQVAAMVCGFGDSVSYETLVAQIAKAQLDKSLRFTDWAHRPLTKRQIEYALADVVHLRAVYAELARRLERNGRTSWLDEEMATLTDPETYRLDPREAWQRLKTRTHSRRFLAVLREVAAWREIEAQSRDLPRNRVLRDDALLDVAAHLPKTKADLGRLRSVSKGMAEGPAGSAMLKAVAAGLSVPERDAPEPQPRLDIPASAKPVVELLKVLLKTKCESHGVAQKLVASSADLEMIAVDDDAPVPALHGWRREVFGEDALALKNGHVALSVADRRVKLVRST
ncbi:MAG: ribonuclease D [Alphaproteobacteria bacterium]